MTHRARLLFAIAAASLPARGQSVELHAALGGVPTQTPLAALLNEHMPMKLGQPVRAQLLYPVYAGEDELLPARTVIQGSIVALTPDRKRRIHARLRADFTPYRIPVVRFTGIALADGSVAPLTTGEVTDGAPFFRIVPPVPVTGGTVRRRIAEAKKALHDQVAAAFAPGIGDRLVQSFYMSLPYHPQRIEKHTAWSFETSSPFSLPVGGAPLTVPVSPQKAAANTPSAARTQEGPPAWTLQAFLSERLTSNTTKTGQTIHAVTAQPIFNEDHSVAVPVGSVLTGTVLAVKPARSFHRAGSLRFAFNQLQLPESAPRGVQTNLAGVDAQGRAQLDSEGQFKPESNRSVLTPLVLSLLASRTLHNDRDEPGGQAVRNAMGANGLGLIGNIIGAVGQTPELAAGIGYYGTAIALYERFLTHGEEMTFARNTRIILETTARRSAPMKPSAAVESPR